MPASSDLPDSPDLPDPLPAALTLPPLPLPPPSNPSPGFAELGLTPALVAAATAAGWAQATAIQGVAVPAALTGRDLLGIAPTGSGKTAAFVLPLLQHLLAAPGLGDERPRRLRALVLAPTRELALQITAAVRGLCEGLRPTLKAVAAVGGASINPQMMALRGGANLVVATPGRLLDLLGHNALRLSDVSLLVLDEADRLLDLGFADEVGRVLAALPARRQTLLFTATMPDDVVALAARVLRDPLRVDAPATADVPLPDITQRAIEVDTPRRTPLLRHLIATEGWQRVLVFVATQYAAEHVADKLRRGGVQAEALHGRLSPGRRAQALADLQAGRLTALVATDLAARGLDIPGLAVVVNHELARSAVDHTHRIGRTGRAGATGLAVSFVCADAPGSEAHFRLIEKRQQQRVPREQVAGFEPVAPVRVAEAAPAATPDAAPMQSAHPASRAAPPQPDPHGGVKGRRKSKKDKLREAAAALAAAPPARRRRF